MLFTPTAATTCHEWAHLEEIYLREERAASWGWCGKCWQFSICTCFTDRISESRWSGAEWSLQIADSPQTPETWEIWELSGVILVEHSSGSKRGHCQEVPWCVRTDEIRRNVCFQTLFMNKFIEGHIFNHEKLLLWAVPHCLLLQYSRCPVHWWFSSKVGLLSCPIGTQHVVFYQHPTRQKPPLKLYPGRTFQQGSWRHISGRAIKVLFMRHHVQ